MPSSATVKQQLRENDQQKHIISILIEIGLLALSSVLFALSFPNFISVWGWFPLGFIALLPVFIVIHRAGFFRVFLYGIFYGYASYALFNFWLLKFHPLALIIVPTIYGFYFLLLFPLLKTADKLFPSYGYLVQLSLWLAFEYLRTRGFLGYSYGVMGYSQYLFLPLARVASLAGIWGVTLFVVFPSVFLGNALKNGRREVSHFFRRHSIEALLFGALFIGAIIYGMAAKVDYTDSPSWRTASIQHNVDPWKHNYEDSLDILVRLSREAMEDNPDVVIWSETAFVPAIDFHTRYRQNRNSYNLVKRLLDFLARQPVPYVIGNDDGQLKKVGGIERIDYNAALLFEEGELIERYRKVHLVPFTENFPFEKQLPGIYNWLKSADTHFWEKGEEFTVFEADGVKFSTPICFEDTFGYISREFVLNGAEVIVNLTNDSWSFLVAAMMQHMGMSVFRAVENKRSVVRSTNGGITCTIDPNGKITDRLAPFVEGYMISEVPVYTRKNTLYTLFGDWFGLMSIGVALTLISFGIVRALIRRKWN
jgi:apolipoprotein N-acyltransferase